MLVLLLLHIQMLGSGLYTSTQNETLGLKCMVLLSSSQKQAETWKLLGKGDRTTQTIPL